MRTENHSTVEAVHVRSKYLSPQAGLRSIYIGTSYVRGPGFSA
jgi:hypothetical protein